MTYACQKQILTIAASTVLFVAYIGCAAAQTSGANTPASVDSNQSSMKDPAPSTMQQKSHSGTRRNTIHAKNKAELKKLEKAGYQPESKDLHYPQDLQKAEKKAGIGASAPQQ